MENGPAPHEQILSTILGYWQANALGVATKLGLADFLATRPLPVDELAEQEGVSAPALFRLMRALESTGIFMQIARGVFANNAVSEILRKDVPVHRPPGFCTNSARETAVMKHGVSLNTQ
jgi:hypothetical protein